MPPPAAVLVLELLEVPTMEAERDRVWNDRASALLERLAVDREQGRSLTIGIEQYREHDAVVLSVSAKLYVRRLAREERSKPAEEPGGTLGERIAGGFAHERIAVGCVQRNWLV